MSVYGVFLVVEHPMHILVHLRMHRDRAHRLKSTALEHSWSTHENADQNCFYMMYTNFCYT